jgi:uncharacterized membrane protein YidH (DUF202 family)
MVPPPDPARDSDPGLAAERTRMAWTRTALAFAAVGAVVLRTSIPAGLVVLATCPLIWALGLLAGSGFGEGADQGADWSVGRDAMSPARRFQLVTITIIVVALVALGVSIFARGR